MPFEHELTVRFHEVDRAGILYFAQVFQYCHIAYEELLSAIFGSVETVFGQLDWGMPLVHSEADFKRPMRLNDRLRVKLTVEKLSQRSIAFAYRVEGEDGDLRATAQLVHAFVNMKTFKSRPAPAELVAGLRRLQLWEPPSS